MLPFVSGELNMAGKHLERHCNVTAVLAAAATEPCALGIVMQGSIHAHQLCPRRFQRACAATELVVTHLSSSCCQARCRLPPPPSSLPPCLRLPDGSPLLPLPAQYTHRPQVSHLQNILLRNGCSCYAPCLVRQLLPTLQSTRITASNTGGAAMGREQRTLRQLTRLACVVPKHTHPSLAGCRLHNGLPTNTVVSSKRWGRMPGVPA